MRVFSAAKTVVKAAQTMHHITTSKRCDDCRKLVPVVYHYRAGSFCDSCKNDRIACGNC